MLGRLMVEPIVQVDPGSDAQTSVATLIKVTENVEIVRWMELPNSLLLFLLVPGDPESGAVYVLDRKKRIWYCADYEDEQFGGYSLVQFEMLLKDCRFLDLVERPGLWRTGLPWVLSPVRPPEVKPFAFCCRCRLSSDVVAVERAGVTKAMDDAQRWLR